MITFEVDQKAGLCVCCVGVSSLRESPQIERQAGQARLPVQNAHDKSTSSRSFTTPASGLG